MKFRTITAIVVTSACVWVTGCQESGGGASAGSGGPTAGSGSGAASLKVPDNARKLASSRGTRLVHRPLRDGTVYVVDETSKKVTYAGPVRANSNVVVDPKANSIAVNDIDVKAKKTLDARHTYALYFVQD